MRIRSGSGPLTRANVDWWLVMAVGGLLLIGLQMVYSSSVVVAHAVFEDDAYFLTRQAIWTVLGLGAMILVARMDYQRLQSWSVWLMAICLIGLVLVLIPGIGSTAYGAQRWLKIGPFPLIQPSELAKVALVIYMADWLSRKGKHVSQFTNGSLPFAIIVGLVAGLVMPQPDLGTAIVLIATAVSIFFVAGANVFHLILGAVPTGAVLCWLVFGVGWRADRWDAFLRPEDDPLGKGWHTMQTLIALGSGGASGLGFGASRQKHYYVPNAHTDAIMAIVGEELGLIGTVTIVVLFGILAWRSLVIALHAPDDFGRLLAAGMASKILWQAILNVSVVTNTVPFTGVTLPFISFGGSSLLVTLLSVGMLLSVARVSAGSSVEVRSTGPPGPSLGGRTPGALAEGVPRPWALGARRRWSGDAS